MITFRQKGDFSNLSGFLERAKETVNLGILNKYGRAGVAALSSATWSYVKKKYKLNTTNFLFLCNC